MMLRKMEKTRAGNGFARRKGTAVVEVSGSRNELVKERKD
jgi:hypothetical protein